MSRNYYRHLIEATPPPAGPLFSNAVAYYKLDETRGQAIDSVNTHNASLFGGVTRGVAGKIGNAYQFDGSTGYLRVPDNNDFTMTNGTDLNDVPFTIRMWIKFDVIYGNRWLINKRGATSNLEWQFVLNNGNLAFELYGKERNISNEVVRIGVRVNNVNLSTFSWYHLVATYDGSKSEQGLSIYVDGKNLNDFRENLNNYQGMSNTISPVEIGKAGWFDGLHFDGKLDEIAVIKNEAWTPAQVAADYNNGNGTTI